MEEKYDLSIKQLNMAELREVLQKVREIEQRHPKETILVWIEGLENKSAQEAADFLCQVFPLK